MSKLLKRNVKRTVTLEDVDGVPRVVKRFHAPGALDRLKDGHRARREFRALARMRAAGLPVPVPVAVRRRERGWELVLEWLEGVPLDDLLAGRAPWPDSPERVAGRLGALAARLVAERVVHPDLHAGNVLVDGAGRPQLLDLARARRGTTGDPARLLARLAAGVRERSGPRFRARFLVAFLRASPGLDRPLGRAVEAVEALEREARTLRRAEVARRVQRWWRESGAVRPFTRGDRRGFARRDLDEALLDELATRPLTPLGDGRSAFAVDAHSVAELRPRWETAARYAMHDLPGERPLALFTQPRARAVLEVPAEAQPLEVRYLQAEGSQRTLLLHGAGSVLGTLDDRGLSLVPAQGLGLLATSRERVELGPGRLVDLHRLDPSGAVSTVLTALPSLDGAGRAAFAAGFVAAHRGTRAEGRRLAQELSLG